MFVLKEYLTKWQQEVDKSLDALLPTAEGPAGALADAMRYSVFSGGKRLRPILLIAGAEAVGGFTPHLMPAACALECIHAYSLIHDDLPAMDNDDLRRGKPTCHIAFDEATAILAGDALLTFAFELMSTNLMQQELGAPLVCQGISLLAKAAGYNGMVGGQSVDIISEQRVISPEILEYIHINKTGKLIQAAIAIGALLGKGSSEEIEKLKRYGIFLGLAFQVRDDLLDVEGDPKQVGKPIGSDERNQKATYPAMFGLKKSKIKARELVESALEELKDFDRRADPLRSIANYIIEREY